MDCNSQWDSILMMQTPLSEDMRQIVDLCLRKNMTDREIYYEMTRIYGAHVVLETNCLDGTSRSKIPGLFTSIQAGLIIGGGTWLIRKLIKRK